MLLLYIVAPGGHVSPEMEQVSSPGSASSTLLEEHHGDEDDEYDEDDATEETEIQSCDHEEVPIETVVPPNRPSTSTYDAIVASEGKIVDAENRRHSDMMTVLERMIGLQEETVSQLAHLHRVFIEVPKQLQKINTSFEALVVQQTQANYWRMTNVPQFNTSQPGSVHAGQFSPHSSDIHSPGPNVTGQVADIAVQVPDDILPLPSVQIQQQTPTKEATKTKQDTHETDQPSLVQCLPTCSHVSLGTSPVREQSLPKSPVGESLPKSPVGESLPKSPVDELEHFTTFVDIWLRFIDDVLMVWRGTEDMLKKFIEILNTNDLNLRLTLEYSYEQICFLDLLISKGHGGLIETTIYRKDTASNNILLASSQYPRPLIKVIPIGQFLRLRRNCRNEKDFEEKAKDMMIRFRARGYSQKTIKKGI
ncbi:uncharacterized protein LOC142492326 [Ascaphus truei]|uniref:uncharacterized protein LOC142492326 n=2 Tax=Ascaphus truei TaxID=8439 RepID=UPI003F5A70A5